MQCHGRNVKDHCCYVNGEPCKFLEQNTEAGQHWSCQLHRENGSWAAAISDPRYFEEPDSPGEAFADTPYVDCEQFQCKECGQLERGEITQEQFDDIKGGPAEISRRRIR